MTSKAKITVIINNRKQESTNNNDRITVIKITVIQTIEIGAVIEYWW